MTNFSNMSDKDLADQFTKSLSLHEETLKDAASIWMEMRERRMDLSRFPHAYHRIMPLIANGKLLPRAVLELAGENTKLLALAEFPIASQKALIEGSKIAVVRGNDVEKVTIFEMNASEASRVFHGGEIQSPARQKKILEIKKPALPLKPIAVAEMRRVTWRQAFKETWRRGTPEDRAWAKAWIKEHKVG